jgi:CSLREA domain-containing protein
MSKRQQKWLFVVAMLTAFIWMGVLALSGSVLNAPQVAVMPTLVQLPDDVLQAPALPTETVGEFAPSEASVADSGDERVADSAGESPDIVTLTDGESVANGVIAPSNQTIGNTVLYSPQSPSSPITNTQNVIHSDISQQPIPNTVVLRFVDGTSLADQEAYVTSFGGTITSTIDALNTVIVSVPDNVTPATLPPSTLVQQSEPDYYIGALASPLSDTFYASQWALDVIGVPQAWEALPSNSPALSVAVIDSGVCASHPDLQGKLLAGWDFVQNDNTPQDEFGHGCAVTGVIVANSNNNIGIAGVALNAKAMPLRVLDAQGSGSYSRVAQAIIYAVDNGAHIINLSLGGASPSSLLQEAVTYAQTHNVTIVAAAGNQGANTVMYPAAYDSVIAVGSVDQNLQRSSFSNYGATIDVYAPGRDIVTTTLSGYGYMSGTSLAAPYVTGVIALNKALGLQLTIGGALLKINMPTSVITVTQEPSSDNNNSCDINASNVALLAWHDVALRRVSSPTSVSDTDVQQARQAYLDATQACFEGEYAKGLVFDYGAKTLNTANSNSAETDAQYVGFGTKWGAGSDYLPAPPPGVAGGQVTYSFMNSGVSLGINDGTAASTLVSIASLPGQVVGTCDFQQEIRNAFTYWGAVANIQFVEVPDNGLPFNTPNATGMIRVGAFLIDGPGKALGHAYFPPPDPVEGEANGTGDIHLDASENWACEPADGIDLGLVTQHEIGHAIGLAHQPTTILSLMNPTYNVNLVATSPNGLQQDDQDGARAIYGIAGVGTSFARNPRNVTLGNNLPTLEWDVVAGVTDYNIQVDNTPDFSSPLLDVSVLNGANIFTLTSPLPNGTFFWRVRPYSNGWGEWTNSASFVISIAIPSLVKPFNNENLTTVDVAFQWTNVVGDNNLFDLQLSRDAEFTETGIQQSVLGINGTTRTLFGVGSGIHYWRVRKQSGDWSNPQQFTIDTNVPTVSSPANGSLQTTGSFDFQWAAVPGASEYQFQIDTSPNFVGLLFLDRLFLDRLFLDRLFLDRLFLDRLFLDRLFLDRLFLDRLFLDRLFLDRLFLDRLFLDRLFLDRLFIDKITTNSLSLNKPLSEGTHYWRVRARRADGTWTGWSGTSTVTVQTPGRSQVVVNEINVSDPSWIELYNKGTVPVDLSTWQMATYTPTGFVELAYNFPSGFTIQPNGYVILYEANGTNTATELYLGENSINWPLTVVPNPPGEVGTSSAEVGAMLSDEQLDLVAELMAAAMLSEENSAQALGNPLPSSSSAQSLSVGAPDVNVPSVAQTVAQSEPIVIQTPNNAPQASTSQADSSDVTVMNANGGDFVLSQSILDEAPVQAQGDGADEAISAQSVIVVNTTTMAGGNDGLCTLIEAITSANTNTASGAAPGECVAGSASDTIQLTNGATYTLNVVHNIDDGPNGLPRITSDVTFVGNGSIIQRAEQGCVADTPNFRLLVVDSATVTFNSITFKNGCSSDGGAILIRNGATVTMDNVGFAANYASNSGGAIEVINSTLTVQNNSSFESNQALVSGTGGAIFNYQSDVTIRNTTFDVNSAGVNGGAIYQESDTVNSTTDIRRSVLNNNSATSSGGGIFVTQGAGGGVSSLIISEVTIQNNNSGNGGGIYATSDTQVTLNASTISGNTAEFGGGINSNDAIISAVNVTISDNTATTQGAAFYGTDGTTLFSNSTIAYNTTASGSAIYLPVGLLFVKNMVIANPGSASNCDSAVSLLDGVNFITDTSCGGSATLLASLSLDTLEDNGGLTRTNALLGSSVAINAVSSCTTVVGGTPIITDQRGVNRPVGSNCDAGAFETTAGDGAQTGPNFTVNTTMVNNDGTCGSSHCTIIEAINAANSSIDNSVITLGTSQTYTLNTINNVSGGNNGLPVITTDINFTGNGSIIERFASGCVASPQFRLFDVSYTGTLTLNNLTLRNGCDTGFNGGGAIFANLGDVNLNTVIFNDNASINGGGAMAIGNNLTAITDSTFNNNQTTSGTGGAIDNYQANLTIVATTFTNNRSISSDGGAIANNANDFSASTTLNNSTFTNNTAINGGAIYASETGDGGIGTLTLNGTTLVNANSATTFGGGIFANQSDVIINNNVVIGGNTALDGNTADRGAGIYLVQSTLNMTGATVRYNVTDFTTGGAGILAENGSTVTISQSTIANNTAISGSGGGIKLTGVSTTGDINDSTFDSNTAFEFGGAIAVLSGANLTVRRSTFSGNDTSDTGAALYANGANAKVMHSTFSGNSASELGGTVYSATGSDIQLQYVTITQSTNIAVYVAFGSNLRIVSSIVADQNIGANCANNGTFSAGGIDTSFSDDASCPAFTQTATPLINTTLADNGGFTKTHALLATSPAINSQSDGCDDVFFDVTTADQRGVARPQGGSCDAGAYEFPSANIFTVTSTADTNDGTCDADCTLREAINAANATFNNTAPDEIRFNIAGVGVQKIAPLTVLPEIAEPVIIDGYTQPGASVNVEPIANDAVLLIELSGENLGAGASGLILNSVDNVTIRGLVINRFLAQGILIFGNSDNTIISGNYIGTDASGTIARPNGNGDLTYGIVVYSSNNTLIGGTTLDTRNIISGNTAEAIALWTTSNTLIYGNYIGVAADGVTPLGNTVPSTGAGVTIRNGASNTRIGGTGNGEPNIIANNSPYGVVDYSGVNTTIRNNSIYNNAQQGIDYGANGITGNDEPDVNGIQNFPFLTAVNSASGQTSFIGTLQTIPNQTYTIDLYRNDVCDTFGVGEGKTYVGNANINVDGSGIANIDLVLLEMLPNGTIITATATSPTGGTSEFSPCVTSTVNDVPQSAPVYTVNTTDMTDDGVCSTINCTLIEAINASNADGVVSVINLANTVNYVAAFVNNEGVNGPNALPIITSTITINGNGSTIRRGGGEPELFRIFEVAPTGNLTLNNLTLSNGGLSGLNSGGAIYNAGTVRLNSVTLDNHFASGASALYNAGTAILVDSLIVNNFSNIGPAVGNFGTMSIVNTNFFSNSCGSCVATSILNNGGTLNMSGGLVTSGAAFTSAINNVVGSTMTLTNVNVSNNTVTSNDAPVTGAGINNAGTLTMIGGTIQNNSVTNTGGGVASGGGIYNSGTLTMTGTSVAQNTASVGGGIYSVGTTTLNGVTIRLNSAIDGGGVVNAGTGFMTIHNSTIQANQAGEDGGGLYNGALDGTSNGTMTITNSTIFGNTGGISGGGILNENNGKLYLSASTVVDNNSSASNGAGIRAISSSDTFVKNSIFANISDNDCSGSGITAQGVNMVIGTTCVGFTQVSTGELNLQALANNGGQTETIALGNASVAIDAATDCTLTNGFTNVVADQRGVLRPQGARCDVGAYEVASSQLGTIGGAVSLVQGGSATDYVRFGDTVLGAPIGTNWTGETVYLPLNNQTIGRDPNSTDSDDRLDWGGQKPTLGGQNEVYVVINEIFTSTQDAVEIANANIETAKLGGWSVTFYSAQGTVDAVYTFPANFTMSPNSYITLYETAGTNSATQIFINTPISWSSWNGVGAVTLTNSIGAGVDYVRFGDSGVVVQATSDIPSDDPDPQPIGALDVSGVPIPRGTNWDGTSPISPLPNQSLGRDANSTDLDLGSDWFAASVSLGEVNPITRPAPNDLLPNITVIPSIPFRDTQSTTAASRTPDEPAVSCALNVGYTLWYQYTAKESGTLRIQTDGSSFDTVLAIYNTALTQIACNDNHGSDVRSRIDLPVSANTTYIIMVGGNNNASGNVTFSVQPPLNDNVRDAIHITSTPFSDSQNMTAASHTITDPTPSCSVSVGRSVWYRFTATTSDQVELTTIGSDYDTTISVWTGTPNNLVEVACNDDGGTNTTSSLAFAPVPNTEYYVMVAGNQDAGNNLVFQSKVIVTPDNDLIANATVIETLNYTRTQDTLGATVSQGDPVFACGVNVGKTVWYQFTATNSANVIFDTLDSGYDTVMAIYEGTPDNLIPVACNDDAVVGKGSLIEFTPSVGNLYYIAVGGYQGASGQLVFKATQVGTPPDNDELPNATFIEAFPVTFEQDTTGATVTLGDPVSGCSSVVGKTVWHRYQAFDNTAFKISTEGSNYDTFVAVWAEIDNVLVEVACNNNAGTSLQSQLTVNGSDTPTTYYIMVGGYGVASGALKVSFEAVVNTAPNDSVVDAKLITPLPYSDIQNTLYATDSQFDRPANCGLNTGRTVWYRYNSVNAGGILRIDTAGSTFDTVITVFTGASTESLSYLLCNDDNGTQISSFVEFAPQANTNYFVMVSGNNGAFGQLKLNAELVPPPSNDNIANATPLSTGEVVTLNAITPLDTRGATEAISDPVLTCNATVGKTVWYLLTVEDVGTLNLTTDGSNFNTVLALFSGTPSVITEIACDDNSVNNLTSRIEGLTLNPGTYYVMVSGSFAEGGLLQLKADLISTPANDLVANPQAIGTLPYNFTQNTTGATQTISDPAVCGTVANKTVWFSYTADSYGVMTISFAGTSFNEIATVFAGTPSGANKVACSSNDSVVFNTQPGVTYYIMVGDVDSAGGNLSLSATLGSAPVSLQVTQASDPVSLPELGGSFTFTAVIKNTSPVNSVTLTSVVDDTYGNIGANCLPALGTLLAPNDETTCTYTGSIVGQAGVVGIGQPGQANINKVTATGVADNSAPVTGTGSLRVEITDVAASMTVNVVPTSPTVPAPSGSATYTVSIQNISPTDFITIQTLSSDVYGAITSCDSPLPATLQLNGVLTCTYSGVASGSVGTVVGNIVTVNAIDDDGTGLMGTANTSVTMSNPVVVPNGLRATYFNNADLTAPVLTRIDPNINFNWRNGSPDPSIDRDTFSVRWTGQVLANFTETYTFQTITNDGVRLWVNGQLLIDYWFSYGEVWKTGSINLVAGQRYDIRMEFYENRGNAMARLRWFSPSTPRQVIPTSNLFALSAPIANAGADQTVSADISNSALVTLNGSASTDDGTITNYSWVLNNTEIATGVSPQVTLQVGTHVITLRATDDTLQSATDTVTIKVTPYGSGGLFATYFNNADLTAPIFTRIDPVIDFNWGNGSPAPSIDNNTFSVRWTGQVLAEYTETYTFQTITNDGVRLWVNGQLLVNYWRSDGEVWKTGNINLVAGQRYNIVMEFYENTGNAMARLRWSSPSIPRQVIPASLLYFFSAPNTNAGADQNVFADNTNTALVTLNGSASTDDGTITTYSWSLNSSEIATGVSPQVTLPVGTHVITLTTTDNDSLTSTDTVTITVLAQNAGGLIGAYYNNRDFTAPVLTRIDPTINFNWVHGSPDPAIGNNTFSIRWTGQVLADYSETYTFYTVTDDGVRLWVNGQLLINDWNNHAATERQGTIALVAGESYDIVMEYYEDQGRAVARLLWSSASTPKQVIPATNLFNDGVLSLSLSTSSDQNSGSLIPDTGTATEEPTAEPMTDLGAQSLMTPVTIGHFANGVWSMGDSDNTLTANLTFDMGVGAGWTAIFGDWNGDGTDGIGVYQDGTWILRDLNGDSTFSFGTSEDGWLPIVGDWDGNGSDTVGLTKDGVWLLRNSNTSGEADIIVNFGSSEAGWLPVAGDWNGDGVDGLAIYKDGMWQLTNSLTDQTNVITLAFGPTESGWTPLAGDWDNNGVDSIGLAKANVWRLSNDNATVALGFAFGALDTTGTPVAPYRGGILALTTLAQQAPIALPTAIIAETATPIVITVEPIATEMATETPSATAEPTQVATEIPTELPSEAPVVTDAPVISETPTEAPTDVPNELPTDVPSETAP